MTDFHVTFYSGPDHHDVLHARRFLEERGIQYEEKDVIAHSGARGELLHHSGRVEYPAINVNGHFVVGFSPAKWEHLLEHHNPGEL